MPDFPSIFTRLREIMLPYAKSLDCQVDGEGEFSLYTRHIQKNKKPLWFGGIQIGKKTVSYHLMPVYMNPALLDFISPQLKKRMQGKSCFNFSAVDEALFAELANLTEASFNFYQQQGYC
jgi:hypothetical protein